MGESESNEMSRQEISDKLKETELTPIVNETNNEYSLIGSKSVFTPKQINRFYDFFGCYMEFYKILFKRY